MKCFNLFSVSLLLPISLFAQNIGIGTTTPAATLHLRGASGERLRLETSAALGSNVRNDIVFRSGNFATAMIRSTGISTNGARLGFYTGAQASADEMSERLTIGDNGTVGIGTVTPQHPLTFNSVLGDKISFWGGTGSATVGHYGIGIANSALQLYSAGPNDDIVFGHGRSGAFVENVRMKGNGNVGIGTNNPTATLQVNGSIRLTDGTEGLHKTLVSTANGTAVWSGATYFRVALRANDVHTSGQPVYLNGLFANVSGTSAVNSLVSFPDNQVIVQQTGIYFLQANANFAFFSGVNIQQRKPYVGVLIEVQAAGSSVWNLLANRFELQEVCVGCQDPNPVSGNFYSTLSCSTIRPLQQGDRLRVRYYLYPDGIINVQVREDESSGIIASAPEFSGIRIR